MIYGVVQSERQFYLKLVEAQYGSGFEASQIDPLLVDSTLIKWYYTDGYLCGLFPCHRNRYGNR
jgi:hypothetical protein